MNIFKKTLFLSNKNENNYLATLTLSKRDSGIFGNLKTYGNLPSNELILGLKIKDKIIKQNIHLSNNNYDFKLNDYVNLEESISSVLMMSSNNSYTPLIWSNEKGNSYRNQILHSLNSSIQKLSQSKIVNGKNTETEQLSMLDESNHSSIDKSPEEKNINSEKYSQISLQEEYVHSAHEEIATASINYADLFESSDTEIESTINNEILNRNGNSHKFFEMIAEQLEELFDSYPKEETLSNLIDNSKWCKIKSDYDNKYYVVGIIYEKDDIKYICYGVPGTYEKEPPTELKNYSQWLPIDITDPYNNGYWVMYQDADTGENILL